MDEAFWLLRTGQSQARSAHRKPVMLGCLELGPRQHLEEAGRQVRNTISFGPRESTKRPLGIDQHVDGVDSSGFERCLNPWRPIHQLVPEVDGLNLCVFAFVCELLRRGDVSTRVLAVGIETQGELFQAKSSAAFVAATN